MAAGSALCPGGVKLAVPLQVEVSTHTTPQDVVNV